ncbi:MAG: hypothetical protein ACHQZS_05440 [Candidatus Binatales bacterium]
MVVDTKVVIERLNRALARVPEYRAKGVSFTDTPEFSNWIEEDVSKWLKAGGPHCADQLDRLHRTHFSSMVISLRGPRFTSADQEAYDQGMGATAGLLESAIENLELGLAHEPPASSRRAPGEGGAKFGAITIDRAESVVVGDKNVLHITKLTVGQLLIALEREIETRIPEPERRGLVQRLKDLTQNPSFASILATTAGELLRHLPSTTS